MAVEMAALIGPFVTAHGLVADLSDLDILGHTRATWCLVRLGKAPPYANPTFDLGHWDGDSRVRGCRVVLAARKENPDQRGRVSPLTSTRTLGEIRPALT